MSSSGPFFRCLYVVFAIPYHRINAIRYNTIVVMLIRTTVCFSVCIHNLYDVVKIRMNIASTSICMLLLTRMIK